jgi:hypothetical protein
MSHYIEIIDQFGNRRRARAGETPQDGETVHFPTSFMDAANALTLPRAIRDSDAENATRRRGWVRGFQSLDELQPPRSAKSPATEAYEEKRKRLENAWREVHGKLGHGYEQVEARRKAAEADWNKRRGADEQPSQYARAHDARGQADSAYKEKCQRLSDGWKNR